VCMRWSAMARRILSTLFLPKPSSSSTAPDSIAFSRSSIDSTSSSSKSFFAFFGPTPSSWMSSTSERGISASTSRSRSMLPVVSSSSMCAATFLPIP
jgi:hypothetical protein